MSEHFPYPGYTVTDVAQMWHYHRNHVYMCIAEGRLRARKSGKNVVIDPESVVELWGQPPRKTNTNNHASSQKA